MYRLSWVRPRVEKLLIRFSKQRALVRNAKILTKKKRKKQSVNNILAHTLAYSLIALQEMNLAFKYPIIFWNTACLITDAGGNESEDIDDDNMYVRFDNETAQASLYSVANKTNNQK